MRHPIDCLGRVSHNFSRDPCLINRIWQASYAFSASITRARPGPTGLKDCLAPVLGWRRPPAPHAGGRAQRRPGLVLRIRISKEKWQRAQSGAALRSATGVGGKHSLLAVPLARVEPLDDQSAPSERR